jgi:hypothetical protein
MALLQEWEDTVEPCPFNDGVTPVKG